MLGKLKRRWGPVISSWIPLEVWHRLYEVELLLPRYHVVDEGEMEHVRGLGIFRSVKQFKADMEFFLRFYTPVTLNDVIRHLDGTYSLPKRCFLPTFDDGFRETHDVIAPILASFGVDGVFFINTAVLDNRELLGEQKKCLVIGALGSQGNSPARREVSQALAKVGFEGQGLTYSIRSLTYRQRHILDTLEAILECDFKAYAAKVRPYLTTAQTVTLTKMGFSIGAHSVDHPLYSELSLEEQLAQTQGCFDYLWKHFKYRCQTFAFPYMDTGISPDFFQRIYADGRLKVSFGSDGMHRHFFPRNLERFKMEYPDLNALQIAAREFYLAAMRKPSWNAT